MKTDNENRKGIVYSSQCVITDKRYIGQAGEGRGKRAHERDTPEKILASRRRKHELAAHNPNSAIKGCRIFNRALRKHGAENFHWEILAHANSQSELDELEDYYIRHFNTKKPHGYNLRDGGNGGALHAETRKKIAEAQRGENNPAKRLETRKKIAEAKRGKKRKPFSEKHRAKMSEAKCGKKRKPFSEKHRANISANNGSRRPEVRAKMSEAKRGKQFSEEHRANISVAQRGRKHSEESRAKIRASWTAERRTKQATANRMRAKRNSIISAPLI